MSEANTSEQVKTESSVEKSAKKQEIKGFLRLQDAPPFAELKKRLGITEDFIPSWNSWWSNEEFEIDGLKVHGPINPIDYYRARIKSNPNIPYIGIPLMSGATVLAEDGKHIDVPPSAEEVDADVEYLYNLGFKPKKPIRGDNWEIPEPIWSSFPTIYDDVTIDIYRDEASKAVSTSVTVHNQNK